jgi:hypothetical protein
LSSTRVNRSSSQSPKEHLRTESEAVTLKGVPRRKSVPHP